MNRKCIWCHKPSKGVYCGRECFLDDTSDEDMPTRIMKEDGSTKVNPLNPRLLDLSDAARRTKRECATAWRITGNWIPVPFPR